MIEHLHFLRSDWFFAFIPLALFVLVMFRRHSSSISWKNVCDKQLLPHILTQSGKKASRFPLLIVSITASLSIIAAAGPVWKKLPQPVFREQSALVLLMDLSKSMDAADLKPSRLERAKLKTLDLLDSRKGGQTALIVYAADAFVVTPLTDDTETISNLVPTLETGLMPAQGSNTNKALEKAVALLKQAGTNEGEILLITDGVAEDITQQLRNLKKASHRLSVLGVGTAEGSPIPMNGGFLKDASGSIVIPKLQAQQLRNLAHDGDGLYVSLQASDADTHRLSSFFSSKRVKTDTQTTQLTADTWQEEGPWLLLLVIPFAALWPRKGWLMMSPVICSTALLSLPEPAYALDTENLWRSSDQKAMQSFNEGDAAGAAELFQQERWKSSAYYRAGDYKNVVDTLKQPTISDDFYNKGNALAQLGRYQEAVSAYDEALKLDENNADANFNRELVKKKLEQQQKQQNNQQDGEQQKQDQNNSDQKKPDQNSQSDSSDAEQQQSQDGQQSDPSKNQQQSEQEKQDSREKKNAEKQDENPGKSEHGNPEQDQAEQDQSIAMQDAEMSEDEQATEQWLKRIPDDPGGLLRRKFIYQYKRMPHQPDKQPW